MNPLGLAHIGTSYEDCFFLWVQPRFKVVARDTSALIPSAALLPAGIARGIDEAFSRDGLFDLRVLGAVHLAFYVAGVWLVLVAVRSLSRTARAVALAGILLTTPDVAYVAYFNSFYWEPSSLIFLLIFLGVALRVVRSEAPGRGAIVAYFTCAALPSTPRCRTTCWACPWPACRSCCWRPGPGASPGRWSCRSHWVSCCSRPASSFACRPTSRSLPAGTPCSTAS
jgi:hypothetical protein